MVAAMEISVPRIMMGRRPMMSAGLDQRRGPTARPRAGMARVQLICSREAENWVWRETKAGTVVVVM